MKAMLQAMLLIPRRRARAGSLGNFGNLGSCDPTDSCSPPFDASTEQWRPLVGPALAAAGLPSQLVDFALAWIRIESDGVLASTGCPSAPGCPSSLYEYGLFQIGYDAVNGGEAQALGIDWNTFVASSTDPTVSMKLGMMLIQHHVADAQALLSANGAVWSSPDFWKLVKGMHALPGQFKAYMQSYVTNNGTPPTGWDDLISYGQATYANSSNYNLRRTDTIDNASWVGSFAPPSADPMFGTGSNALKTAAIVAGVAAATLAAIGLGWAASQA